jgi:UDP-N-acetylmuramate dehydrogenase
LVRELADVPLSERTTLRLGGRARRLIVAATESELIDAVRAADAHDEPVLVLGGGSNVVVADGGFDGVVIDVSTRGVDLADQGDAVLVTSQAGEDWERLVAQTVSEGLVGFEALSGIPGRVGATPIQNVGAYGQDVSQTLVSVCVYDRARGAVRQMSAGECGFSYRNSVFKGKDRFLVLAVAYRLERQPAGAVVRYAELARVLGVQVGGQVPAAEVRAAVLALRRSKGMVLDAADHDTWSAGSFFTNPVLATRDVEQLLPPEAPRWPESGERTKVSAAWLIERSGFSKGYGSRSVRLSTKHTLALTNRGGARTSDLLALAHEIKAGVLNRFGIELVPEPVLVGCTL